MSKIIKLLIISFLCFPYMSHAISAYQIDVYISNNKQSQHVAQKLINKLELQFPSISIISHTDLSFPFRAESKLVITVGTKATSNIIKRRPSTPVYSLMVPRKNYQNIIKNIDDRTKYNALFIDQPFERYIEHIKYILPNVHKIGLFLNNSDTYKAKLIKIAESEGLQLDILPLEEGHNPTQKIDQLVMQSDAIILMPNKPVNRLIAKWILFSSYKQGKPVIGFSKQFLEAGAISVLYSDLEDIAKEASEDILTFLQTGQYSTKPHYPANYQYEFNSSVFKTLRIEIPEHKSTSTGDQ